MLCKWSRKYPEVSVVRKRLKVWCLFSKVFFLNGGLSSRLRMASLISPPSGKKYLAEALRQVSIICSASKCRPLGMMSLEEDLPTVVSKTLCFFLLSMVCWGCLSRYQHVSEEHSHWVVSYTASSRSLKTILHLHDQLLPSSSSSYPKPCPEMV